MATTMIMNILPKIGVPLFGNASTALSFTLQKAKVLPRYAKWGGPAVVGGTWFVWPAVTDDFKISIGLLPDPEQEGN